MNKLKKYTSELFATYFLVFCGTGAIVINQESGNALGHLGVAISWGLIVTIMILVLGRISGAHMNPVVTLVFVALKIIPRRETFPYLFFQVSGAFLASLSLSCLFPNNRFLGSTHPAGSDMQSFTLELIVTFLLIFVVLFLSQGNNAQKRIAPFAIGMTVLLEALFVGPICGASMNPTRSLAPAIVSGQLHDLWIYCSAPLLGGILAAIVWRIYDSCEN